MAPEDKGAQRRATDGGAQYHTDGRLKGSRIRRTDQREKKSAADVVRVFCLCGRAYAC